MPAGIVRALAAVAERGPDPLRTRYAVDQLTDGMVLDITRARNQGWTPRHRLRV